MSEMKIEEVGELKKGRFVMIDGEPCKIVSIDISKTGKHGHGKARIEGFGVFDKGRHTLLTPTHDTVSVPIIDKMNAQVLAINGDSVQLMDLASFETFDLAIPEDMKDSIQVGGQVGYWVLLDRKILMKA